MPNLMTTVYLKLSLKLNELWHPASLRDVISYPGFNPEDDLVNLR